MKPEWISAIAAAVTALGALAHALTTLWMRATIAEFRNNLTASMDERYLRKPATPEDYPVSRRELELRFGHKGAAK
jgi:hypothetical protein